MISQAVLSPQDVQVQFICSFWGCYLNSCATVSAGEETVWKLNSKGSQRIVCVGPLWDKITFECCMDTFFLKQIKKKKRWNILVCFLSRTRQQSDRQWRKYFLLNSIALTTVCRPRFISREWEQQFSPSTIMCLGCPYLANPKLFAVLSSDTSCL